MTGGATPPAGPNPAPSGAVAQVARRIDHLGIATADLDGALAFYRDALGMRVTWDEVVEEQGVRAVFLAPGPTDATATAVTAATEIELLASAREDSPIARFIAKRGPGLHHVACEVADLTAALAVCRARGLRLVDETPRRGARGHLVAFLHPASAGGVLLELVEVPHP